MKRKRQTKVLDVFTVEGVQIATQLRGVNPLEKYTIQNSFHFRKGYLGMYKGKNALYKNLLPYGMVRHHEWYNDEDIDEGVVFITTSEHAKIHYLEREKDKNGRFKEDVPAKD